MKPIQLLLAFLLSAFHVSSQTNQIVMEPAFNWPLVWGEQEGLLLLNIQVTSTVNIPVTTMVIRNYTMTANNNTTISARLYSNNAFNCLPLVAQNTVMVSTTGGSLNVSIPFNYALQAGQSYLLGFYHTSVNQNNLRAMYMPINGGAYSDGLIQGSNITWKWQTDFCPGASEANYPVMTLQLGSFVSLYDRAPENRPISLFPIPAAEQVAINLPGEEGHCHGFIINALGETVMTQELSFKNGMTSFSLSSLRNGSYVLHLKRGNTQLGSKQLLVYR
jgi:hypothetical protein